MVKTIPLDNIIAIFGDSAESVINTMLKHGLTIAIEPDEQEG